MYCKNNTMIFYVLHPLEDHLLFHVNVNTYKTFNEARLAIFEFIESWYNNRRIHSTLGYITPNEKYELYIESLAVT